MSGSSRTMSSSLRTAPSHNAADAIAIVTLPKRAKVGETADIVLKNMPLTASPHSITLLLHPAAPARAGTLPGQGCALYNGFPYRNAHVCSGHAPFLSGHTLPYIPLYWY
jgi:hypothetical protein